MGAWTRLKNAFRSNDNNGSVWGRPGGRRRAAQGSIVFQQGTTRRTKKARHLDGFDRHAERPSDIPVEDLEQVYRQEPVLRRAILKHAGDLVRQGFRLVTPDADPEAHPENDAFQAWARRIHLHDKLRDLVVSAHVYGDGFAELAYPSTDNPATPVTESERLDNVFVADPTRAHLAPKDGDVWYVEERDFGVSDQPFHPDRYDQLVINSLPGYLHGLPTTEAAWHAAHSKVMGDQAIGEVLFHCGVPFRHARIDGADEDEVDEFTAFLNQDEVIRGYASDETHEITQLNPETVDPGPFYEALVESIAAAVGIPKAIARGAQAGSVAGAEENTRQYHEDLQAGQQTILTPFVERLAQARLGLDAGSVRVEWHGFEIDEQKLAETQERLARAFNQLVIAGIQPEAAAETLGLDLDADAFTESPLGSLPPGGGV